MTRLHPVSCLTRAAPLDPPRAPFCSMAHWLDWVREHPEADGTRPVSARRAAATDRQRARLVEAAERGRNA
jgi:hypothetical protein